MKTACVQDIYQCDTCKSASDENGRNCRHGMLFPLLLTRLLAWELRLQDPLPLPQRRYHFKQNPFNYLHPEY